DTGPAQLYTLSLHDALPIWRAFGVVIGERKVVDHSGGPGEKTFGQVGPDGRVIRVRPEIGELHGVGVEVVELALPGHVIDQFPSVMADDLGRAALRHRVELVVFGAGIVEVQRWSLVDAVGDSAVTAFGVDAVELGGRVVAAGQHRPEAASLNAVGDGTADGLAQGGHDID